MQKKKSENSFGEAADKVVSGFNPLEGKNSEGRNIPKVAQKQRRRRAQRNKEQIRASDQAEDTIIKDTIIEIMAVMTPKGCI